MQRIRVCHLSFNTIKKKYYFYIIIFVVSIMWRNWKTITIKNPHLVIPDDDPVFKYDDHHDETININTGEVITND